MLHVLTSLWVPVHRPDETISQCRRDSTNLGVSPQKVDEEDDDDATDIDHGAPEAQRRNELPEGLEDGVRDLTG